jgi:hypothetical protein
MDVFLYAAEHFLRGLGRLVAPSVVAKRCVFSSGAINLDESQVFGVIDLEDPFWRGGLWYSLREIGCLL